MTNKEWLNRGWKLLEEIEILEMTADTARKRRGEKAAAEYGHKVKEKQRELIKVYLQILKAINRLEDRKDREVLQLRYLANMTHEQIRTVMGYEETRSVARRIDSAAEKIICR